MKVVDSTNIITSSYDMMSSLIEKQKFVDVLYYNTLQNHLPKHLFIHMALTCW